MNSNTKRRNSAIYRRIHTRNIFLIALVIIVLLVVCLFTPVFSIKTIYVTGNEMLTDEQVIKASGIDVGENLFLANTKKAEKNIGSLGYIEDVSVNRKFWSDIHIKVRECTETAYIAFSGNYVGIDENAKVLSITKSAKLKPKKTVISGFALKKAEKGEKAEAKDSKKDEILKEILSSLKDEKLISKTKKIDLSDKDKLKLVLSSDTSVILGSDDQINYKVKCLRAVLKELGEIRGGKINVTDPSNVIYEGGNQK